MLVADNLLVMIMLMTVFRHGKGKILNQCESKKGWKIAEENYIRVY